MNIPNFLTLIRFLLVPIFFYTFYTSQNGNYIVPFAIFIFAGITDVLDGYIARKFDMVTRLGMLLDPLADKVMQISVLFAMTTVKIIPMWIILVILLKELFLIIGSGLLYKKDCIIQANYYGKLSTVLFYISILIIIFINTLIGTYCLVTVVFFAIYATVRYTIEYFSMKSLN